MMKMIFLKDEEVPGWLAQGPDVKFGCDVVVDEYDGGYRVRPRQKISGNECLITAKDCPTFPKRTLLWCEPSPSTREER